MPATRPNKVLTDLRKQRDNFRDTIKKQSEANEGAWIQAKAKLEAHWRSFEAEVKKYVEASAKKSSNSRRRSRFKPTPN